MRFHVIAAALITAALVISEVSSQTVGEHLNESLQKKAQPSLIRTQLRVSKSLNPDDTETINVKSNTGGYAAIIVKKRDGKNRFNLNPDHVQNDNFMTEKYSRTDRWNPVLSSVRFAEPSNNASSDVISSFIEHVKRIERKENLNRQKPSENSWYSSYDTRNERQPAQLEIFNDQYQRVPEPTIVRSTPVFVKNAQNLKTKRGRSMIPAEVITATSSDNIPVIEGIRMPDDEEDKKKTWRNARVIKGELVPYENGYKPSKVEMSTTAYSQLVFNKDDDRSQLRSIGPFTTSDNHRSASTQSFGPFTVDDNMERISSPSLARNQGTGPYFVTDNSRISNSRLIEYIKRINDQYRHNDFFAGRSSKSYDQSNNVAFPSSSSSSSSSSSAPSGQRIQRRMLQNAKDYFSESEQQNIDTISEGLRAPVFEYAHPELGIQPARVDYQEKSNQKVTPVKKVQYYVQDTNKKNYFPDTPLNSHEYFHNDPYFNTDELRKPSTYPFNYGYLKKVKEQPLWMKLTEQVRDSFQNGMTTVEAMARPVIDPLMEAGEKISKNLGFAKQTQYAQNKVGFVSPATGSIILPALGLVAGGAALGIGAIAVGRYFDGNILKRSDEINLEHKRTFEKLNEAENMYVLMQPNSIHESKYMNDDSRSKRSINDDNNIIQIFDVTLVPRENFDHNLVEHNQYHNHKLTKRSIPSTDSDDMLAVLQDVEKDLPKPNKLSLEEQIKNTDWKNTSCAKKVFCEVMISQGTDEMVLMEKKMETMLAMMHPTVSTNISPHLSDVSDAIHRRDCSVFECNSSH